MNLSKTIAGLVLLFSVVGVIGCTSSTETTPPAATAPDGASSSKDDSATKPAGAEASKAASDSK